MTHIKVINEPTELVPLLRALDTPIKRQVFDELIKEWRTMAEIVEKYGEEGREALMYFEKMKLVEINWIVNDHNEREKVYRSYYYSFHINTSCPINEMKDILTVAIMDDDEFCKYEKMILDELDVNGGKKFVGDLIEKLDMSTTMLKSIIKRSTKLDCRGHRVEKFELTE